MLLTYKFYKSFIKLYINFTYNFISKQQKGVESGLQQ